jgi:hypothetical protein
MNGVVLLVAIGLSIATVYGPWQWYCVDRTRQKLFEIRARVFNLAAAGEISFASPQYLAIRDSLNKRLRFAHRVCWQQMPAITLVHPNLPSESELTRQIRSIENPALRAILEKEARRARQAMADLIIHRSPFLLIAFALQRCIGPQKTPGEPRQPEWPSAGERVSVEAENIGPLLDRQQHLKAA